MTTTPSFPVPRRVPSDKTRSPEECRGAYPLGTIPEKVKPRMPLVTFCDPRLSIADAVNMGRDMVLAGVETEVGWHRDDSGLIVGVALFDRRAQG